MRGFFDGGRVTVVFCRSAVNDTRLVVAFEVCPISKYDQLFPRTGHIILNLNVLGLDMTAAFCPSLDTGLARKILLASFPVARTRKVGS